MIVDAPSLGVKGCVILLKSAYNKFDDCKNIYKKFAFEKEDSCNVLIKNITGLEYLFDGACICVCT